MRGSDLYLVDATEQGIAGIKLTSIQQMQFRVCIECEGLGFSGSGFRLQRHLIRKNLRHIVTVYLYPCIDALYVGAVSYRYH